MFIATGRPHPPAPAPWVRHVQGTGTTHTTPAGWEVRFHAAPLELGQNSLGGVAINMALLPELPAWLAWFAVLAV